MHEMAICRSLLEIVVAHARQYRVNRVTEVNVQMGELRGIVPEYLRYYFDLLKKGTAVEGATLNVERVPGEAQCAECAERFALIDASTACPACGSFDRHIVAGNELRVTTMRAE